MSELARYIASKRKPPAVDPDKPRPSRVTKQRRDRLDRDEEYKVLNAIYLEEKVRANGTRH